MLCWKGITLILKIGNRQMKVAVKKKRNKVGAPMLLLCGLMMFFSSSCHMRQSLIPSAEAPRQFVTPADAFP